MPTAIILSQGTELTTGRTLDSNAHWLCQQLWDRGYSVQYIHTVPDDKQRIIDAFQHSVTEASLIISTGGLGPTEDDYTIECLALAFHLHLETNEKALQHLHQFYQKRNRIPSLAAQKMALLPMETIAIHNPIGSATGVLLERANWKIICLPGVPVEMKAMFTTSIPTQNSNIHMVEIAMLGMPESEIVTRLADLIPKQVNVGYQATRRGNILKLRFPKKQVDTDLVQQITTLFSDNIFGINETDLAAIIGKKLNQRGESLSTAESCTAGKIASWVASISGASSYFMEGVVVYSNEAKHRYCDVPLELIASKGAVSREVALGLANGIKRNANTDWALAVTGIAGPNGGSPEKPVGTVHIACAGPNKTIHQRFLFQGIREQITESAATSALFMLYQQLNNAP